MKEKIDSVFYDLKHKLITEKEAHQQISDLFSNNISIMDMDKLSLSDLDFYAKAVKKSHRQISDLFDGSDDIESDDIESDESIIEDQSLYVRVVEEMYMYPSGDVAAKDHLEMAAAHLHEEFEGRNVMGLLTGIDVILYNLDFYISPERKPINL